MGAAAVAARLPEVAAAFAATDPRLLLAGAAAGCLLALVFRRSRALFALAALALAGWALIRFVAAQPRDAALARYVLDVTALLLPLDLGIVALMRERGVLTATGMTRLVLIAAQPAVAAFLWVSFQLGAIRLVQQRGAVAARMAWSALPDAALVAFGLAAVAVTVAAIRNRSPLERGLLWALAASFLAFGAKGAGGALVYLAAGALAMVAATLETSFAMAFRDPLTGLPGRRAMDEAMERLPSRFAIAMVDVDHFKAVNDSHGHDVGDQVLRMVAARIDEVGGGGRGYRCGGEEFAVLFPSKSAAQAAPHAEALRQAVADEPFALRSPQRPAKRPKSPASTAREKKTLTVTVSIGLAERGESGAAPAEVLAAADGALLAAKRGGRNRVELAGKRIPRRASS